MRGGPETDVAAQDPTRVEVEVEDDIRQRDLPGGRDDEDGHRRAGGDGLEDLRSASLGQHEVEQDEIERLRQDASHALLPVHGVAGVEAGHAQAAQEHPDDTKAVLDDEDVRPVVGHASLPRGGAGSGVDGPTLPDGCGGGLERMQRVRRAPQSPAA